MYYTYQSNKFPFKKKTVRSALVSFMQVFDDRIQAESGWNSMDFHPFSSS